MLRRFIKCYLEVLRWRWLFIEDELKGISNVTIRTIITALSLMINIVISDILFGWLELISLFSTKKLRIGAKIAYDMLAKKYGTVLSWEEP